MGGDEVQGTPPARFRFVILVLSAFRWLCVGEERAFDGNGLGCRSRFVFLAITQANGCDHQLTMERQVCCLQVHQFKVFSSFTSKRQLLRVLTWRREWSAAAQTSAVSRKQPVDEVENGGCSPLCRRLV
jgi:hypothetical protein